FKVTATGLSHGVLKTATTTFTDGSAAPSGVSAVWTPGQLVVSFEGSGNDNPVYEAVFINGARPNPNGGSIQSGTLSSGSPTVTGMESTVGLVKGQAVSGTGIPTGTTIASVDSSTQITLSNNATAGGSQSLTFNDLILSGTITSGSTSV